MANHNIDRSAYDGLKHETHQSRTTGSPSYALCEPDLNADILVPERRVIRNKLLHHLDAAGVLKHIDFDTPASQQLLFAHEGDVFADDHMRNTVKQDRAGAHRAGRKRRVQDTL